MRRARLSLQPPGEGIPSTTNECSPQNTVRWGRWVPELGRKATGWLQASSLEPCLGGGGALGLKEVWRPSPNLLPGWLQASGLGGPPFPLPGVGCPWPEGRRLGALCLQKGPDGVSPTHTQILRSEHTREKKLTPLDLRVSKTAAEPCPRSQAPPVQEQGLS